MDIMNNAVQKVGENNILRIIKGSIVAVIITLALLLVFSFLLAYTNLSEEVLSPVIIAISAISILVGSIISSMKIRRQGLINGGFVGLIYIATIYLISSIVREKLWT